MAVVVVVVGAAGGMGGQFGGWGWMGRGVRTANAADVSGRGEGQVSSRVALVGGAVDGAVDIQQVLGVATAGEERVAGAGAVAEAGGEDRRILDQETGSTEAGTKTTVSTRQHRRGKGHLPVRADGHERQWDNAVGASSGTGL